MRRPSSQLSSGLDPDTAQAAWEAARPSSAAPAPINLRCELITPMYGGGVEPGTIDRELPIRPGALRGQLRFWWRLLNGAGLTPQELFNVESGLWGGISSQGPRTSRVVLRVRAEPVEELQLAKQAKISPFPDYALIGDEPDLLKAGYEFEIELRFERTIAEEQRDQVVEALRWWASFGGVGARTRRGLGAVRVTGERVELTPVTTEEVASRGGRMALGPSTGNDAAKFWKDAVDALKRFRQGPGVGRNSGASYRPGRSRWPEPDAIRRLTGRHAPGHEPQHPVGGVYPRAAFGLPIVFHFKDHSDPHERTLVPECHDRMASPLILRPWFDGRQYRPLALLLPGWEECLNVNVGFDSKDSRPAGPAWPSDIAERARLAGGIEPMRSRGNDPLSAFMHYFEHD